MSLAELTVYATDMIGWLNFALIVGAVILVLVIGHLYDRVKQLERFTDEVVKYMDNVNGYLEKNTNNWKELLRHRK